MKVLHLLPVDARRGAQTYARMLADALGDGADEHETLTIYHSSGGALGGASLGVPLPTRRRRMWDYRAAVALRRHVRGRGYDVVVVHGSEPLKYVRVALSSAIPVVYLRIGVDSPQMRARWRQALYRHWITRAQTVVGVSAAALESADALGLPATTVRRVIHNGRPADVFTPGSEHGEPPLVVFVGQLEVNKRPDAFCRAVAAVRARGLDLRAAMVGEGPDTDRVRPLAASAGVELLGRRHDVPDILRGSDVLVMCSRPPEGMPGVLIEAGLSGVPVVTTDIPGASEVIADGRTGLVVPIDDDAALAEAIATLVSSRSLRTEMGQAARERCAERFTLAGTLYQWREVLNSTRSTTTFGAR